MPDGMISNAVHRILTRRYGAPEEINGGGRCETYLYRWVARHHRDGRAVYVHRFVSGDWSRDLHDHPKAFRCYGVWGGYLEETVVDGQPVIRRRRAPFVNRFAASHRHRLVRLITRNTWTVVVVGPHEREWGFWTPTGWVKWSTYIRTGRADAACVGVRRRRDIRQDGTVEIDPRQEARRAAEGR